MPTLSIITINFNNAQGLLKTIESVDVQTFTDFEYIVVDGLSTDGSLDIIKQYKQSTNHPFNYIYEPDSGVYNAMNKGILLATGEYLLFLNSGDFLVDKNVLQNVFNKQESADILYGGSHISDNMKIVCTIDPPENITFGSLYNYGLAHQSTFIKRSMFDINGLYREDFKYNSDIDFWYRAIILNNATTKKIGLIISDYNLDGISSKEYNTEAYKSEIKQIMKQSNFDKFIPDYDAWKYEHENMEVMYWVKSKKMLYGLLVATYNFSTWLVQKLK